MDKITLGIVGQGFVGTAVREGMLGHFPIQTYDRNPRKSTVDSLRALIDECHIVFVCLPTPMRKSGECDISILESVLSEINSFDMFKIVVIKSTIPPGTTDELSKKYQNLELVFNPEFLTEANSINDHKTQNRVIVGGSGEARVILCDIFRTAFPEADIIQTSPTTAEMIKYVTNTFLATKVSFANEMYDICCGLGIDYDEVIDYAKFDERLGNSHWAVPGPDGDRGYGGHCFPKDIAGLKFLANSDLGIDTTVLNAIIAKNDAVRQDRNWERQPGRAISE